jgi:hypothetical protein
VLLLLLQLLLLLLLMLILMLMLRLRRLESVRNLLGSCGSLWVLVSMWVLYERNEI